MIKRTKNKAWYKRWWIILIYIVFIVYMVDYIFDLGIIFDESVYVKRNLEEIGYEVINVNYFHLEVLNETWASVDMKSPGDDKYIIESQAQKGLWTLYEYYNDATHYTISIITPTRECFYSVDGNIFRTLIGTDDNTPLFDYLNSQIEKPTEECYSD